MNNSGKNPLPRARARLFRHWTAGLCLFALLAAAAFGGETDPSLRPTPPAAPDAPTALIELDGTLSENPDGGQLQYEWRQVDGPKVVLSDHNAAKPYFRTAQPGVYRFELTVIANGLRSDPTPVEIEIERANLPPTAKVPTEVWGQVGKTVEIDGRESFDPEGASLTYRWRPLTKGLNIPLPALSMPVLVFEPTTDGVYEVELVVSDGEAASPPAIARLAIKPRPRPPVARAKIVPIEIPTIASAEQPAATPPAARPQARIQGPEAASLGEKIVLDARGSRSDGGKLKYLWRQKSGPFVSNFEHIDDGQAEAFVPPRAGDYEFELVVSDGSRDSEPAVHRLQVRKPPEPPVAVVVAPNRAAVGALVKMDATQSYDLDGETLSYRWRQTGGPIVRNYVIDEKLGDSAPAFTPQTPGKYVFELVVASGRLHSKPVEIAIDVSDRRSGPELTIKGPEVANVGERLLLTANSDDAAAHTLRFAWRQAEGPAPALPPTDGPRVTVTPPVPGRYVFELSALENGRTVAAARRALEVFGAAPAEMAAVPPVPAGLRPEERPATAPAAQPIVPPPPAAAPFAPPAPLLVPPPQTTGERASLIPELQPLPSINPNPAPLSPIPALAPLPLATPMPMAPPAYQPSTNIPALPPAAPASRTAVSAPPSGRAAARIHPASLSGGTPPVVDLP